MRRIIRMLIRLLERFDGHERVRLRGFDGVYSYDIYEPGVGWKSWTPERGWVQDP